MQWETSTQTPLGLLTLLSLRGVGKLTAPRLARSFPTLDAVANASEPEVARTVPAGARKILKDKNAWQVAHEAAHSVVAKAATHDVRLLSVFDDLYPPLLRRVPDAPPIVFVKGKLRATVRNVACVGTRSPSFFGTEVTKRMVRVLAECGFGIISGLAVGIDTVSHQQALASNGYTVAVLANGLDSVYPRENARLAEDILKHDGALISEQPFGTRAFAQNLVQRDRLQSGMSLGTFVFQTDLVGGTMHTVRFTLLQGRTLFAPVPPTKFARDDKCRGTRAIVEKKGGELADLLAACGKYRELLTTHFAERPPAIGVTGTMDYPRIIEQLQRSARDVESRTI